MAPNFLKGAQSQLPKMQKTGAHFPIFVAVKLESCDILLALRSLGAPASHFGSEFSFHS